MKTRTKKPGAARSLTTTLSIAFLVLSVVVLMISSGLQALINTATQQQIVSDKLQLIAHDASLPVNSFIQGKFSTLATVAQLTDLASLSPTEQRQILKGLLGRDLAFRQLVVLDAQNQEQARASRLSQAASGQLTDQLGGEALTQIKQGANHIGPVYIDSNTGEPLVLMAIPATNALGDFQGTLGAEVNLKFMWDLVALIKVGETGAGYVVDRRGNLLAFKDTARVLKGENVGQLNPVRQFMSGAANTSPLGLSTGIEGASVIAGYASLGTPDWAVVAELPLDEAYRGFMQNLFALAVNLVMVSALTGLLGAYLARRLAVPLVSLTKTATRIAAGEMNLQAAVGGSSEVASLATAFNSMTAQLRGLIADLEQRVAERTAELTQRSTELEKINQELGTATRQAERRAAQLAASAQVARAISQVRDLDELLSQVTHLIGDAFGYYHVGIFIKDELDRFAVLRAANSEGGQRMLARGHKLSIGKQGIVGYVIAAGQSRIALDIGADAVHFDNPDLPETHSEIALPLQLGDQTFGALDVHSSHAAAFTEEDVAVLAALADQIVIALENARLFAQSQAALQEAEEIARRYQRQEWARLTSTLQITGHEYHISGVPAVGNAPLPEIEQAIRQGRAVVTKGDGDSPARAAVAVPIKLRDQVVGVIDLHETDTDRTWTEDDIAILTAVADQAGLALENVRLIEETERLANRERLINQINARVRQTVSIDSILKTAVNELGKSLTATHVFARVSQPETTRELEGNNQPIP